MSIQTTHTPKPWKFEMDGEHYTLWGGGRRRVLTIRDGVIPMLEDERLIEAAPELLEALTELLDQLDGIGIPEWHGAEGLSLKQAKAAIEKARGE
jgi:hypothetical protein